MVNPIVKNIVQTQNAIGIARSCKDEREGGRKEERKEWKKKERKEGKKEGGKEGRKERRSMYVCSFVSNCKTEHATVGLLGLFQYPLQCLNRNQAINNAYTDESYISAILSGINCQKTQDNDVFSYLKRELTGW